MDHLWPGVISKGNGGRGSRCGFKVKEVYWDYHYYNDNWDYHYIGVITPKRGKKTRSQGTQTRGYRGQQGNNVSDRPGEHRTGKHLNTRLTMEQTGGIWE